MHIEVKFLHNQAKLPMYGSDLATGADLHSVEDVVLEPGDFKMVGTGIAVAPGGPEYDGLELDIQVRPRSGLAAKHGVTVLNTPGTIDADYRGEIKVILINHGKQPHHIQKGDRIAQLVVQGELGIEFVEVDELEETVRGEYGFGSSGR
jgi:dUTP pyrophosphatase